jgi:hypothetical protein
MDGSIINFVLRSCLIVVIWVFFWRLIEPQTLSARVLRAGLLVLGLLVILVVIKLVGN